MTYTKERSHSTKQTTLATRLARVFISVIADFLYLFSTSAPLAVYIHYLKTRAQRHKLNTFLEKRHQFTQHLDTLHLSNDWFSRTILHWLMAFEKCEFYSKPIKALEVGSWEGLSSYFILKTLPHAHLTCVDTWQGADEHKGQDVLHQCEDHFDSNLFVFKDRLFKFKGTSFNYFNSQKDREHFDLIYIDGSHHCDDVIIDAIKGFELLKVGGIMIFDDYFWPFYKRRLENPAGAINAFLNLKRSTYRIVDVYYQLIIQKTMNADEARTLLESIKIAKKTEDEERAEAEEPALVGLRDRALIGVMVRTFARVNAVLQMKVRGYFVQGRCGWVRLHE